MARPQPIAADPGAERRAMIALVAVFALLVQALLPSLVHASPLTVDGKIPLCAADASGDLPLGDLAPEPPCDHCVVAAVHALAPAPDAATPVAYSMSLARFRPPPALRLPPARAPPRPPGQGPPSPIA